jgi:hypothetical protein
MIRRPIITDAHIHRAFEKAHQKIDTPVEYRKYQSRALRLVAIKTRQDAFIHEGKDIEEILETLGPKWNLRFWIPEK